MSAVAGIAAAIVGLVFVIAGATKVAMGRAWPEQARAMGAPRPVAIVVPWIELAVGALLVVQVARPWPAVAAIAILASFSALIARHLIAGRHPTCACFGAWSAEPVGAGHLVRNAMLLALAAVALL